MSALSGVAGLLRLLSRKMDNNQQNLAETGSHLWRFKDLLIISGGIVFLLSTGFGILGLILNTWDTGPDQILHPTIAQSLIVAGMEAIALIGGVYFFGIRRRNSGWDSVGLKSVPFSWLVIAFVITSIAIPITGLITLIVMLALGMPLENPQLEFLLPEDITGVQAFGMILLAGILAPFGEEVFFRGVLYQYLRDKWGVITGVIVSSLLFGLIHLNLAVGITAFLLGILLAVLFEYSRSLWTSVLIHAVNNSTRIALLYLIYRSGWIERIA